MSHFLPLYWYDVGDLRKPQYGSHMWPVMNILILEGPGWLNELGSCRAQVAQWVRYLDYLTTHTSLSPIRRGFVPSFVNYKKRCTRLAAASDKDYRLLAYGRWFSPASFTTKTGRHDIAKILLKVALKHQKSKSYTWKMSIYSITLSWFRDYQSLFSLLDCA
jgi:hypothetical protein